MFPIQNIGCKIVERHSKWWQNLEIQSENLIHKTLEKTNQNYFKLFIFRRFLQIFDLLTLYFRIIFDRMKNYCK